MKLERIVGLVLVAGPLLIGGLDAYWGARHWSSMWRLPPEDAFRITMLDGRPVTPSSLRGKVSVLTFWATWCGVCRSELVDLDALDDRYRDRPDVQFIAVNKEGTSLPEARALVEAYRRQRGLDLPVALDDGSMGRSFRVKGTPYTVLVDRQGVLRHVHQGRVRNATLQREIDELLAE